MTTNDPEKEYEDRLQMSMELLCQKIDSGQLHVAPDLKESIWRQLSEVKKAPDGAFILESISPTIRALATGWTGIHYREETKKICSLQEIQAAYFTRLEDVFGDLYKIMVEHKASPGDYAKAFAKANHRKQKLLSNIGEFLEQNEAFWLNCAEIAYLHVEELNCLKTLFGGDLMPAHNSNIASSCGLYVDTIILPEPFIQSKILLSRFNNEDKVYYFIKHGLNLLKYKDAVLSDTKYPIAVVLPNSSMLFANQYLENRFLEAKKNSIYFSKLLFGREFSEEAEIFDYVQTIKTESDLIDSIQEKDLLLLTEINDPLEKQIAGLTSSYKDLGLSAAASLGMKVYYNIAGRMRQANDIIGRARQFNAAPLIEAPTSWQYLQWSAQLSRNSYANAIDVLVPNVLSRIAVNEISWLGNLPITTLVKARKSGFMEELRGMFKGEIAKFDEGSNTSDLENISIEVTKNINNALIEHQDMLKKIDRAKACTFFIDGSKAVVNGIFNITSCLCGLPFSHSPVEAALISGAAPYVASQITKDMTDFNSVKKELTRLSEGKKILANSALGLLCSLKK